MRTVRRTLGALAVLASCCLYLAAPAPALEPGVHVDPGSPAGKEYSLPLGQARQTGGSNSSGNENSNLFGAGIKPPNGGKGGGQGAGGKGGPAGGANGGAAAGPGSTPAGVVRAARDHSSDASLLALIGGGVAILVLGAFGGTVLRHRRPPSATQRPTP